MTTQNETQSQPVCQTCGAKHEILNGAGDCQNCSRLHRGLITIEKYAADYRLQER